MSEKKYIRLSTDLFSSVARFIHSSDYFPTHDRRIGVSTRIGYHPEHKCVMVEIEEERPSFLSTTRGEYVTPGEAESITAKRLLELSAYCLEVAKELQEHSIRLREIVESSARGESTILDMEKVREIEMREERGSKPDLDYDDPIHTRRERSPHKESPAYARSTEHAKNRPSLSPGVASLNLALLK